MKIVQEKEKVGEILSVDQGCQEATNSTHVHFLFAASIKCECKGYGGQVAVDEA